MSRRSLRPQLNQIRGWVRQGRTDAWIAHQLEVTVQQIQAFKREQGLEPDLEENGAGPEEVDLRAEDDAQIAAELEAEAARKAEEEARPPKRQRARPPRRRGGSRRGRGGRRETQARRAAPRWSLAPPRRARGPARGHVRPRRGGLRAVARSRRPGRPDLRRALVGPSARRDHDRGGPDRDPQVRRRRGRRGRLSTAPPRSRGGARRTRWSASGSSRGRTAASCARRRRPTTGTRTSSASRAMHAILRPRRSCARATRCWPASSTAARASRTRPRARGCGRSSSRAGWVADRLAVMCRAGPGRPHADVEEVELRRHTPAARRVVPDLRRRPGASSRRSRPPRTASPCGAGCARSSSATTTARRSASRRWRDRRGRGRDRPALRHARSAAHAGSVARLVEAALAAGGRDVAWVVADDEGSGPGALRAARLRARSGASTPSSASPSARPRRSSVIDAAVRGAVHPGVRELTRACATQLAHPHGRANSTARACSRKVIDGRDPLTISHLVRARTRCPRRSVAAEGLRTRDAALPDAAPAREVGRGALIAPERGVGDDPGVPGERLVRRDLDREVGAPARFPRRRGRRARRA